MKRSSVDNSRIVTALAVTGAVGPVLFWVLLLAAQSLHPGYDAVENSVSRLTFSPYGWLQIMNFCLLTLVTAAFGGAVYLGVARSRAGRAASFILMVSGLVPLLTAILPVDLNPLGPKSLSDIGHIVAVITGVVSFPLSVFLLVPDLKSDERWRSIAYLSIAAATLTLILELLDLVSVAVKPHLVDPWFGVYERILLSVPLVWMMVVSVWLLYIRRR